MAAPISPELTQQIADAVYAGRKIEAIRLYREHSGQGLKESKDFIEALEGELRAKDPAKFTAPPAGKGCLGAAAALLAIATLIVAVTVSVRGEVVVMSSVWSAGDANAPESVPARLEPVVQSIERVLPEEWFLTRNGMAIVVERKTKAKFVNMINSGVQLSIEMSKEKLEEYRLSHSRELPLAITLTFVPKISQAQLDKMRQHNADLSQEIEALTDRMKHILHKDGYRPATKEDAVLVDQLKDLRKAYQAVPDYYIDNWSVYLPDTRYALLEFTMPKDREEYVDVMTTVKGILKEYDPLNQPAQRMGTPAASR